MQKSSYLTSQMIATITPVVPMTGMVTDGTLVQGVGQRWHGRGTAYGSGDYRLDCTLLA